MFRCSGAELVPPAIPLGRISKTLFSNELELLDFAKKLLYERMESLENDVKRCTEVETAEYTFLRHSRTAPFPALLYCFSTIDLLGALYCGNARSGSTTKNSAKYMADFMGYRLFQIEIIQGIFRHKIVHLAQPKPVMVYKSKCIAWYIETQEHRRIHLRLNRLSKREKRKLYPVTSKLSHRYDYVFHISVRAFQKDIKESVEKPNGYLEKLTTSLVLQERFSKAILDIHSLMNR